MSGPDKPKTVEKSTPNTSQVEATTTTEQPDTTTGTVTPVTSTPKSTPAPTAAPAQTGPVVVTSFREVVIDEQNSDCEYTYSDGSTSSFHWKSWDPQAVQTMVNGQLQFFGASKYTGICDATAIGLPKN